MSFPTANVGTLILNGGNNTLNGLTTVNKGTLVLATKGDMSAWSVPTAIASASNGGILAVRVDSGGGSLWNSADIDQLCLGTTPAGGSVSFG